MDLQDLVQRLTIVATTEGVSSAATELNAFASAQTQTAASALSMEKAAAIVERRWDSVAKVEQQAARDTTTLVKALQQRAIDSEKAARLIASMGQRIDELRQKTQAAATAEEQHARALEQKRAAWTAEAAAIAKAVSAQRSYNSLSGVGTEDGRAAQQRNNEAIANQMRARAALEDAAAKDARAESQRRDQQAAEQARIAQQNQAAYSRQLGVPSSGARAAEFDQNATLAADIERRAAEQSRIDAAAEVRRRDAAAKQASAANAAISSSLGVPTGDERNAQFNRNAEIAASMEERATAEMRQLRNESKALLEVLDPLAPAQARYNAELERYAQMAKAGLITADQQSRANTVAAMKLKDASEAAANPGKVISQNAFLLQNLSFQINDIVSGLAMGQSPFTIMAQQGGQVYQVLSMARGGVGGGLRELADMLTSMITPARLAMGAIALGAVAAAASVYRLRAEQEALTVSTNGAGRAAGVSPTGLRTIADAAADKSGITRSASTSLAGAFASTGQLGSPMISSLIEQTNRYAKVTGQDLASAGQELAGAFADPTKGADDLNRKMGLLDDTTRQTIRSMQEQGNLLGAQSLLLDKLSQATLRATDPTSNFAKAWERVKKAADDAFSSLGRATSSNLQDKIAELDSKRTSPVFGWLSAAAVDKNRQIDEEVAKLQKKISDASVKAQKDAADKLANDRSSQAGDIIRGVLPDITDRQGIQNRLTSLGGAMDDPLVSGKLKDSLTDAGRAYEALQHASDTYLTTAERERAATNLSVREILAKTLAEREGVAAATARLDMMGKQIDAETRLATEARKTAEVMAQAAKQSRDALRDAREGVEKSTLLPFQQQMKEIEIRMRHLREETQPAAGASSAPTVSAPAARTPTGTSSTDPIDILAAAMAKSQPNYGVARQIADGDYRTEGNLAIPAKWDPLKNRNLARPANDNQDIMRATGGRSTAEMNAETERLSQLAAANAAFTLPMKEQKIALDAQIASLQKQAEAFGLSTEKAAALSKEQDLLNQFARQGVPLNEQQKQQISDLAAQYGNAARAAEELQLKQKKAIEVMDLSRGAFDDVVGGWARGLAQGQKGIDAFRAGIEKLNERLLNFGLSQLQNALFGQSGTFGGSNSGLFGGSLAKLIGGMFGGGSSYGSSDYFSAAAAAPAGMYGPGFANGGIMTDRGPVPLRTYSKGGIANSPQMAMYGEGKRPEAYVPLPDGRSIPVTVKGGQAATQVVSEQPMKVEIHNYGNAQVSTTDARGPDGSRMLKVMVESAVLESLQGNGPVARGLQSTYGLNRTAGRRL